MEVIFIINDKKLFLLILAITTLLCSCATEFSKGIANEDVKKATESNQLKNSDVKLPVNYSVEKIKIALSEYINYRLWMYPALENDLSKKNFDKYVDKTIDVEIRLYTNTPNWSVYANTSIGNWLLVFTNKADIVYCEGQVSQGEKYWPQNNDYQIIEKFSLVISKPHKPSYGTSAKKDKMIAAFEAKLKSSCESFYKDADYYDETWKNADVYIADFYEYEIGTHAWLCKQDGTIISYPVVFEEVNGAIRVQPVKPDEYKSKDALNEIGQHLFEREIGDAVKLFKCNIN